MIIDLDQKRMERELRHCLTVIDGECWYDYIVEYRLGDSVFELTICARDFKEAEQHLKAIGRNGKVMGVIVE